MNPRLLPKSLHDSYGKPPQKLPRIENEDHEMNWVNAAKGKTETSCPFEYAARLTEVMLLGIVALRAGKKINYDGANMRVTNVANRKTLYRNMFLVLVRVHGCGTSHVGSEVLYGLQRRFDESSVRLPDAHILDVEGFV